MTSRRREKIRATAPSSLPVFSKRLGERARSVDPLAPPVLERPVPALGRRIVAVHHATPGHQLRGAIFRAKLQTVSEKLLSSVPATLAVSDEACGVQRQHVLLRGRQYSVRRPEKLVDPQRLSAQVQALEAAGAVVCESNAAAARLAAFMVNPL